MKSCCYSQPDKLCQSILTLYYYQNVSAAKLVLEIVNKNIGKINVFFTAFLTSVWLAFWHQQKEEKLRKTPQIAPSKLQVEKPRVFKNRALVRAPAFFLKVFFEKKEKEHSKKTFATQ